jgi:hypothetical protein
VDFCEHGTKALDFIKCAEWVSDLGCEEGLSCLKLDMSVLFQYCGNVFVSRCGALH